MATVSTGSAATARVARDARFDGRFFTGVLTTRISCRPDVSGEARAVAQRRLLSHCGSGRSRRIPPVPALPAGDRAGNARVAWRCGNRVPCAALHRARLPRRRQDGGRSRRHARDDDPASAASVRLLRRRVAERRRDDPSRAASCAASSTTRQQTETGTRCSPPSAAGVVRDCSPLDKPRHDRLCWLTLRDCLSFKVFFLQYTTQSSFCGKKNMLRVPREGGQHGNPGSGAARCRLTRRGRVGAP